jgi:phage terminase large subunit
MLDEARLYQYKVDRITGDILPIIVDKHNHGWDATRYSLDGVIKQRGEMQKIKIGGL